MSDRPFSVSTDREKSLYIRRVTPGGSGVSAGRSPASPGFLLVDKPWTSRGHTWQDPHTMAGKKDPPSQPPSDNMIREFGSFLSTVTGRPQAVASIPATGRGPITREVELVALKLARRGQPARIALAAAGVSDRQQAHWRGHAASGEEPYKSFLEQLDLAAAEGISSLIEDVRRAAAGGPDHHGVWKNQWKAAEYLLGVLDPGLQARQRVEVAPAPPSDPLDLTQLTEEELDQWEALQAKARKR